MLWRDYVYVQEASCSSLSYPLPGTLLWCVCAAGMVSNDGIALHPGLAALGTLRWALPSPPPFPVAPPAPSEEECRFQVCRTLFMWPRKSAVNYKYLIICQVYSQKNLQTDIGTGSLLLSFTQSLANIPFVMFNIMCKIAVKAWWSGKERSWVKTVGTASVNDLALMGKSNKTVLLS